MAKWVQDDNNTGVYYVSTAVVDQWIDDAANRIFHMQVCLSARDHAPQTSALAQSCPNPPPFVLTSHSQSYDCASFVIRVFDFLYSMGVTFDQTVPHPKYSRALACSLRVAVSSPCVQLI